MDHFKLDDELRKQLLEAAAWGKAGITPRLDEGNDPGDEETEETEEVEETEEEVEKVLEILYDEMVNYPTIKEVFNIHFDVPLAIDAEVGRSFGDGKEIHFEDGKPKL